MKLTSLMVQKNQEIARIQNIYGNLLEKSGVKLYSGKAGLLDEHRVRINDEIITSERILIATGGLPTMSD